MRIDVECYAGHRGEQTPRRFAMGDRWIEVGEPIDQWLAPEHRYFKLMDAAGATYILRHDVPAGAWELWMYQRAAAETAAATNRGNATDE